MTMDILFEALKLPLDKQLIDSEKLINALSEVIKDLTRLDEKLKTMR